MPPAIIAVAVGLAASAAAAAGIITATVALVITIGAAVAGALLTKAPSFGGYTSSQERKQILRSSTAPCVTIYGTCVVSGLLFFAEEQAGTEEKEWIHLAIAIADHPIEAVTAVWLGDDPISAYGNLATYTIHSDRSTVDPFMKANCSSWKDDMIGKGITWARISLKFDNDKFPAGLPNIKFEVKGKRVYDPRNQTTAWSENAALCILDYYRSHLQVPDSDINMDQFIQAANICDQTLNDGGGNRRRYTINGTFDADEEQASILDELHKACAGEPTYMAGKHGMLAGAYYGPATMELHSDQIISDVKLTPEAAYGEKLNVVTGTFLDPQQQYSEVDYPAVSVQQYIDDDGAEFTDDLKLRFVNNEFQAQQLAQIKINRTRVGRTMTFSMNLSGYSYRPGYYVKLFIPEIGITGAEHRIIDWGIDAEKGVQLTLRQETPAVWGDAIGKPIERPDITDFPSVGVAQPTNLAFTPTTIGDVVQGIFSWTNTGIYSYNIVYVRQNGNLIRSMQIPGQSTPLNGLPRGNYTLSVAAVGPMGTRSAEAILPVTIAAPAAPTGCDIIQQFFGFTLKPRTGELYNVVTQFDFWTSGETRLPNSATATVEQYATRKGLGKQMADSDLQNDHKYYWYIRAVNIYGMSEFLEVEALCFTEIGDLMDQIDEEFQKTDTYKNLVASVVEVQDGVTSLTTIVEGQSTKIDSVQTSVGDVTATVQQQAQAFANLNGKLSAQWGQKVQIDANGNKYVAGMQMGVEGQGGQYQSYWMASADNFAVYNPVAGAAQLAFLIKGTQTYIREGFIENGSISNLKIGNVLQSYNWNGNDVGWCINKDGWATFNNVTVRGTIYGNDGYFNGTIRANKIDGDVCAIWTFPQMSIVAGNGRSQTIYWRGGLNYPARICIPYSSISMGVSRPDNQFRAQLTINGVVMFDETFNNTASTIRNVVGYVDVPAGAVNVPITINVWKVQGGQSNVLYFNVNRFTVIVSPATDRFFS